ncbi:MAG: hypothetical protein KGS72_25815 [Cyanobacteria bacterium REEB67]|nr:hypothetical protein [Cyanobacteria bacterium REEB67]
MSQVPTKPSKSTAQTVAQAAAAVDVEVTAYTSGPAIFREKRVLHLPAGKSTVAVAGLPQTFVPNSLTITGVTGEGNLKLGALSYREPSLTIEAILKNAVGTHVTIIERTQAGEVRTSGTLLNVLNNQAVLQEAGALRLVSLSDRIDLGASVINGLTKTSSLQLEPNASREADYTVGILFAADGLSWNLNYEAFYDAAAEKLDRFACWVNVTNKSGADIDAAKIKLIFGANTGYEDGSRRNRSRGPMMAAAAPMGGGAALESMSFSADAAEVESVGEQKLYTLPDALSIAQDETKQTMLFLSEGVPVKPEYFLGYGGYALDPDGERTAQNKLPVNVRLKLTNATANQLGLALPPGTVKIFEADSSGSLQRTDASRVAGHIASGEEFELALNTPCKDLKATRRLTFFREDPLPLKPAPVPAPAPAMSVQAGPQVAAAELPKEEPKPRFREEEREIILFNYKGKDVEVKVQDAFPCDFEFIKPLEGVRGFAATGGASTYSVVVPKNGQTKLTYRIKYRIS